MKKSAVNYEIGEKHIPVSKLTDQARLQNFIAALFPDLPHVGNALGAVIYCSGIIDECPAGFFSCANTGVRMSAIGEIYDDEGYLAIRFKYFGNDGNEIVF